MPKVVGSNTKEVHLALLRDKFFYPTIEDNQDTTDLVKELAVVSALISMSCTTKTKHDINVCHPHVPLSRMSIVQMK